MGRIPKFLMLAAAAGLFGCDSKPSATTTKDDHGHTHGPGDKHAEPDDADEHVRGTMMIEHAGPYHCGLTAHLDPKDGNELDLTFETVGKEPKPIALAVAKIVAKVARKDDPKTYDITFEPAPAKERPADEKPGTCSHFVAKAPFVTPTDILTVSFKVVVRDKERAVTFDGFDVKKFSETHKH
jgi:hypothetical protein